MTADTAGNDVTHPGEQRGAMKEPDVTLPWRSVAGTVTYADAGPHRVWNPAQGPSSVAAQRPPGPPELRADGTVVGALWASSEAPCRVDPGGAGGSPDGRSLPIRKVVWD